MATLIPVLLLSRHGVWNAGEIAGFEPDTAAALIKTGRAAPYTPVEPPSIDPPPSDGDLHILPIKDDREMSIPDGEQGEARKKGKK